MGESVRRSLFSLGQIFYSTVRGLTKFKTNGSLSDKYDGQLGDWISIRRLGKKTEVAWKRGLRALRPSRRLAVKTNGCRKKFQDGASKY